MRIAVAALTGIAVAVVVMTLVGGTSGLYAAAAAGGAGGALVAALLGVGVSSRGHGESRISAGA